MRRALLLSVLGIAFSGSALAATSQSDFLAQYGLAGEIIGWQTGLLIPVSR